jgi:hypothetical protein
MKLFRTLTLAAVALTFALGTAFAQAPTTTKPAAAAKTTAAKATPVAVKDLPKAVTDAITAAYPKGTITKATSTGTGADLVYSVSVKVGTKTTAYKYTADGKAVPPVKK